MIAWFWRWIGLFQMGTLVASIALGVPALLDVKTFNGMDLLALVLFIVFLWLCFLQNHHDDASD